MIIKNQLLLSIHIDFKINYVMCACKAILMCKCCSSIRPTLREMYKFYTDMTSYSHFICTPVAYP